mmetsp:Transcript_21608/g.46563  ORF Transcript_21608/g.46563 Transcript_21608/m.46563 type:complete len:255 (-) Transcript_21608:693-1457(-)
MPRVCHARLACLPRAHSCCMQRQRAVCVGARIGGGARAWRGSRVAALLLRRLVPGAGCGPRESRHGGERSAQRRAAHERLSCSSLRSSKSSSLSTGSGSATDTVGIGAAGTPSSGTTCPVTGAAAVPSAGCRFSSGRSTSRMMVKFATAPSAMSIATDLTGSSRVIGVPLRASTRSPTSTIPLRSASDSGLTSCTTLSGSSCIPKPCAPFTRATFNTRGDGLALNDDGPALGCTDATGMAEIGRPCACGIGVAG